MIFTLGLIVGFFSFPMVIILLDKYEDWKEDEEEYKHGRRGDR